MRFEDLHNHYQVRKAVEAYGSDEEKARFGSLHQANARAWLHASTKLEDLLIEDVFIADGIHRIIGLPVDLPPTCKACNKSTLPDPHDHGIRCGNAKGGAGTAGGIVERAVIQGLKSMMCDVRVKPELDGVVGFQRTSQGDAKIYGDALVQSSGRSRVIDVTFSSRAGYSLLKKEQKKVKEYIKHRDPKAVANMFVPCAMDLVGGQGERMRNLFADILKAKQQAIPEMKKEFSRKNRYVQENLSVAALKAIGAYMQIVRHGYVQTKHNHTKYGSSAEEQEEQDDQDEAPTGDPPNEIAESDAIPTSDGSINFLPDEIIPQVGVGEGNAANFSTLSYS